MEGIALDALENGPKKSALLKTGIVSKNVYAYQVPVRPFGYALAQHSNCSESSEK